MSSEIGRAKSVLLYAEPDDFPLDDALVEIGIALSMGRPITVCLPGVQIDPTTASWISHPLVIRDDDIARAMSRAEMRAS